MRWRRWPRRLPPLLLSAATLLLLAPASSLRGQGTTATIGGTVRAADGSDVGGTRVTVVNTATGYTVHGDVRDGRFLVHGLEVGGPYTVSLHRLGLRPLERGGLRLRLGEPLELHFVLESEAVQLDPLRASVPALARTNADGGIVHYVSDSLLHRLPTLNRNIYDFVRLAPQISTRIGFAPGGLSGGGAGFRFNEFLINGVSHRSVGGHVPAEFAGGRSVPFDAVSEYQLLLAPFDVRHGDFVGALVNAVTKSGTNELRGSVFAYARNDALARGAGPSARAPYERLQYGVSAGGPILRDRVHFFVAPEFQHFTSPAPGPYVAEAAPSPVSESQLMRLDSIMLRHSLVAGTGAPVENRNPLVNLFGRVDLAVPEWRSRAVLSGTWSNARNLNFARPAEGTFPLTSNRAEQESEAHSAALQVHTSLARPGGGHNELLLSQRRGGTSFAPEVHQPLVRVGVQGTSGSALTLVSGPPVQAHGGALSGSAIRIEDELTFPLGAAHVLTLGLEMERFRADRRGTENAYGTWDFSSLDSLAAGIAEHFEVRRDTARANVRLRGTHLALYAGDRWRAGERLSLTFGIRAELLTLAGHPPYNPEVDSIFQRRTDELPARRVQLSPRFGFTWDVRGDGRDRLRGGAGVFTARAPGAWLHAAFYSYGASTGVLRCGRRPTDVGDAPSFVPNFRTPPAACANGTTSSAAGDVNLLGPDLSPARSLRAALAYDRRVGETTLVGLEVLVTGGWADFVFVNRNLAGPQGVDANGRVLYGTLGPTGQAAPSLRSPFAEVIELRNTSRNHAYQLSARLERPFARGSGLVAYYTFSRVRDVQTPLRVNVPARENWASRAVSGRHEDLRAAVSLNDVPHRVVLAATRRAPWSRWTTELSLIYTGESGSPFTYRAYGESRRGDLNADGSNTNDPIYVPRDAADTSEIRLATPQQAAAFEQLIRSTRCLREQRGRIVERNSCREPWFHSTVASLRQAIPVVGRGLEVQLDLFNVLNLLRSDWGQYRLAAPAVLEHVGQESGQPVFRFDPAAPRWTTLPAESAYQLQLGLRYRF